MFRPNCKRASQSSTDRDRSETNERNGYTGGQDKKRGSQERSIRRIRDAAKAALRPDQRAEHLPNSPESLLTGGINAAPVNYEATQPRQTSQKRLHAETGTERARKCRKTVLGSLPPNATGRLALLRALCASFVCLEIKSTLELRNGSEDEEH